MHSYIHHSVYVPLLSPCTVFHSYSSLLVYLILSTLPLSTYLSTIPTGLPACCVFLYTSITICFSLIPIYPIPFLQYQFYATLSTTPTIYISIEYYPHRSTNSLCTPPSIIQFVPLLSPCILFHSYSTYILSLILSTPSTIYQAIMYSTIHHSCSFLLLPPFILFQSFSAHTILLTHQPTQPVFILT